MSSNNTPVCRCRYERRVPWINVTELEDARCGNRIVRTRGYHEHMLGEGRTVSNWQGIPVMGVHAEYHWA